MTEQITINRLVGPRKPTRLGATGDDWHVVCKLCPRRVDPTEQRVWLTKPMGVSHQDCAAQAGLA